MRDKAKQYKRITEWKKENIDRFELVLPKGTKEKWKQLADQEGLSLSQFIYKKVQGE